MLLQIGDDWGGLIQVLIIVLFFTGGIIRAVYKAFKSGEEKRRPPPQRGPAQGQRRIHDVLEEIRREVGGEAKPEQSPRPQQVPDVGVPQQRAQPWAQQERGREVGREMGRGGVGEFDSQLDRPPKGRPSVCSSHQLQQDGVSPIPAELGQLEHRNEARIDARPRDCFVLALKNKVDIYAS